MALSIAIIVLMILINLFMIYAIVKTWKRVNEKVEKYFLHNASDFGPIREEVVTKEDFKTAKEADTIVKSIYVAEESDTTFYQNENFAADYKEVKQNMEFSKKEVIKDVLNKDSEKKPFGEIAINLKEKLNFEVVYDLSTLTQDLQLSVLNDTFDENEKELLRHYVNTHKNFEIIGFSDYVKHLAQSEDPTYYVRTGWANDDFDNLGENVKTVYDENITEGVKIVHKDKLYDYSI